MKRKLKVFFAGKIDPLSPFASPFWREEMTWQLNKQLQNYRVTDTSLIPHRNKYVIERNLPVSILFSQSCYYIQQSDVFVVNLTNDISIGGSQEIFIAKQSGIPVIGIAPRGGKFNRLKYELGGKTYWNWVHPFVEGLCDLVVNDVDELTDALDTYEMVPNGGLTTISDAVNYYQRNASALDTTVNHILSFSDQPQDLKQKLRIYFAGKMGKAAGFSEASWRDEFSAIISQKSRFRSVNLDFLEASHDVVDEADGKLIFGRDTYLIRSSDLVVVNLSDDISVGGAVEMMLAKLYHRPLIGIARQNGKFVNPDKDLFGRVVPSYINPFVSATCDWLIHDVSELPGVVDELFRRPVKSSQIIPASSDWYKKTLLRTDKAAQIALLS